MSREVAAAVADQDAFAAEVFERLRAASADVRGVTRASYGAGEQAAHALMAEVAAELGLEVSRLGLGMMTYGSSSWRPWVLDPEAALPILRRALEIAGEGL